MKTSNENITLIKEKFKTLSNSEEFLELINIANRIIYGEKAKDVKLKSLTYYANYKIAKNRYREFYINKKSGGKRSIHAPVKGLKQIQRSLNLIFQSLYDPKPCVTGFVKERSIVDNAKVHVGMNYVYNIDLRNFFPSVDLYRVKKCLTLPPFNLIDKKEPLAYMIANLCCENLEVERLNENNEWEKKLLPVLPQGAPTSPILTNIIAQKLDRKLIGLAKRFGLNYTRYADDITFSSMHNVYAEDHEFRKELNKIIRGQGFHINLKKVRLQKEAYRQEVTGLVVNEKVNVRRRYIKQIRMWLYYWENYGQAKAQEIFEKDYISDRPNIEEKPELVNVLFGSIQFVKMVLGPDNKTYYNLEKRFESLFNEEVKSLPEKVDFDSIIDTLLYKGLNDAMDLYVRFKEKYA